MLKKKERDEASMGLPQTQEVRILQEEALEIDARETNTVF